MPKESGRTQAEIKLLGIAGSLRAGSYNKAILRAAGEMLPQGVKLDIFDIEGIPAFNQDLEADPPERVKAFKTRIKEADGLIIATPEANYSVPGVLKNAIDWASRPYGDNAFNGKPVAIMGASIGTLGTARAQYHLRQICVFLNMYPLNRPEVMVPLAQEKVDANGRLTDGKTRELIGKLVEALVAWIKRLYPTG